MTLDPGAARLLRMLANAPRVADGASSAPSRREALLQLAALTADPPDPGVAAEDLICRRRTGQPPLGLRLYRPRNRVQTGGGAAPGLIVYLHGGGWVAGDLATHDGVCRALTAGAGCPVIAVDYRRPPEHPFPAAVHDAVDAVLWASAQARRFGADPSRLALAGDSAGANLAAAAASLLRGRQPSALALLVLLCPILEIAPSHPSRREFAEGYFLDTAQMAQDLADYLGDDGDARDPLASPLLAPDLTGLPATQLHLAQYDPFRDEALAYAERLAAAGVPVRTRVHEGMIHYFYAMPRLIPNARAALAEIAAGVGAALTDATPAC
jgi:acetyl esterase